MNTIIIHRVKSIPCEDKTWNDKSCDNRADYKVIRRLTKQGSHNRKEIVLNVCSNHVMEKDTRAFNYQYSSEAKDKPVKSHNPANDKPDYLSEE